MEKSVIIEKWELIMNELKSIHSNVVVNDIVNLSDDNIYFGILFVTKIYGLNSLFDDEFIKENHLEQIVKWIDTETVKIQASHYSDKSLFYEFFQVIYPQLKYRLSQIKYKNSLSENEKKKLIITAEYHVYLTKLLKYYLEQQTTIESQEKMKEILSILNLYSVVNDPNIIALGSEVVFMDTVNNEIMKAKIVIDSHVNHLHHKYSINELKSLISEKKDSIVCIDFSTSYFVRIIDVKNEEEKPKFR